MSDGMKPVIGGTPEPPFRGRDLRGADLRSKQDAVPSDFGGANLLHARLPFDASAFELPQTVERLESTVAKVLLAIVLAGITMLLYAFTTDDVVLIANLRAKGNPFADVELPSLALGIVGPVVLLAAYVYLHLIQLRVWDAFARTPTVRPDGRRVDEDAPVWAGAGFLRQHAKGLEGTGGLAVQPARASDFVLLWAFVPTMIALVWFRYLVAHIRVITLIHCVLIALSLIAAYQFYGVGADKLGQREPRPRKLLSKFFFAFVAFGGLSIVTELAGWPAANISYAQLSTPVSSLVGAQRDSTAAGVLRSVRGADLRYRDLRNARASFAFLVNADLTHARLQKADLTGADLRGANLAGAVLDGTRLDNADLRGADLRGAVQLSCAQVLSARTDSSTKTSVTC